MALASLYYHCNSLLTEGGLSSAALLGVPVLSGALIAIQRRRNARTRRD